MMNNAQSQKRTLQLNSWKIGWTSYLEIIVLVRVDPFNWDEEVQTICKLLGNVVEEKPKLLSPVVW